MSLKRMIRTLALAAVAAMLVTAVGAAGASAAEPEVWQKGAPLAKKVAFTSKSGVKVLTTARAKVECKKDSDTGELTGPRTDKVKIRFFECKYVGGGECTSLKPAELEKGEIMTNPLSSRLVWLNKAKTIKGIDLKPEAPATEYTEFECKEVPIIGKIIIKVTGSVLGEIPPAEYNVEKKEYKLKFECEPAGSETQKYLAYWEEEKGVLKEFPDSLTATNNVFGAEKACEEEKTPDELTFAEAVEVR